MKSIVFLLAFLVAPCAVVPSALAQTPGATAPDAGLTQHAISSFGGPRMWISPDLFLLGRPSKVDDNSALWFWSRAKGVFEVKLPNNARPELDSLCASDHKLQWLSPAPPHEKPGQYTAPKLQERRVYKLTVDPANGAFSVNDASTMAVTSIQYRAGEMTLPPNRRHDYKFFPFAGCRLVNTGDMIDATNRVAVERGLKLHGQAAYPFGLRVAVGPSTQNMGADYASRTQVYLDWDFQPIAPEQANAEPVTPFGPLTEVDTANEPDPFALQLQVSGPEGKPRAIFTAPPGHMLVTTPSPDACALLVTPVEAERITSTSPRPPPPPRPAPPKRHPYGLGPADNFLPGVMIDLCSAESRALVAKPLQ